MTYVIMKDFKGSLHVSEVIEDIDSAIKHPIIMEAIAKYGENILPVRINNTNGWCVFNPRDRSIVKQLESDSWPELSLEEIYPVNNKYFDCGWISPEYTTYFCDEGQHFDCAKRICEKYFNSNRESLNNPEDKLLEFGWIKVSSDNTFFANVKTVNKKSILFALSKKVIPVKEIADKVNVLVNN